RFKEKAQLAVLNKKLNILLSRKGEIEKALSHTEVDIAENAERLKRIEEEFKKTNSTIKLSRKLAENPLYQQSLAEHSGSDIKKMFNLNMEVEIANPTYQHLEKKLVDVIPTLSALYVKRDSLQAELKANTLELKTTQVELANKETELQRLKRTYDLAFGTYKMFVKKFEEVTIQVAMMSQDLKILDPAIIPEEPFKPKKKLNVLIAGVIGSMMFLVLAFFREYLERAKKKQEGAV
ncbi:MAG: GNVR domain-containing protein, partial [bacterium]